MNKWEIKQIIDCVSKGVNSVLMNTQSNPDIEKLKELASDLTEIYISVLKRLKNEPEVLPEDVPDDLPVIEEENEPIEVEDLGLSPEKEKEVKQKVEKLKEKINASE